MRGCGSISRSFLILAACQVFGKKSVRNTRKKVSETQERKKCQKHKKDLTSFQCHDKLVWRMEVGLFFMPKIHQPIKAVSKKQRERGGSFAHKNYIGMYRMQTA